MTDKALSSPQELAYYFYDKYNLMLSEETCQSLNILMPVHNEVVGAALYRFEAAIIGSSRAMTESFKRFNEQMHRAAAKRRLEQDDDIQESQQQLESLSLHTRRHLSASSDSIDTASNVDWWNSTEVSSQVSRDAAYCSRAHQTELEHGRQSQDSEDFVASTADEKTPKRRPGDRKASEGSPSKRHRNGTQGDGHIEPLSRNPKKLLAALPYAIAHTLQTVLQDHHVDEQILTVLMEKLEVAAREGRLQSEQYLIVQQALGTEMQALFTLREAAEIFAELDREEAARSHTPGTLASAPSLIDTSETRVGHVTFEAFLAKSLDQSLEVRTLPPVLKTSTRFARRFGSSSLVRIHLRDAASAGSADKAMEFLQNIRIAGHVFFPIYVADGAVVCFRVNAQIQDAWALFDWHGSWDANRATTMSKYLQRIKLGLSATEPGPIVAERHIHIIDDIVSDAGNVLTDGAAPISADILASITRTMGYQNAPCAFQGRVGGAKGMWYLDHSQLLTSLTIRKSQLKLIGSGEPCQRTIDVVQPARVLSPSSLSREILIVLDANGVPPAIIRDLQKVQLQQFLGLFFTDGSCGKLRRPMEIAKVLEGVCGVYVHRLCRTSRTEARAKGLSARLQHERFVAGADLGSDDNNGDWNRKSSAEKAYDMLLADFKPNTNAMLTGYIFKAINEAMESQISKFHIPLHKSAELFVIPDPVGVLKRGEIQVRFGSSQSIITDPDTQQIVQSLEGDVLVTRHPCRVPSDIRKVRAVVKPELSQYTDVILFSTRGEISLAEMLSGGDMDGDTIRVIWDPLIVDPFCNAKYEDCLPSEAAKHSFAQDTTTVDAFLEHLQSSNSAQRNAALGKRILEPLKMRNNVGIYGNLHTCAVYEHGCASREAIDLAYKFNNCLDGAKTGMCIKPEVLVRDRKRFESKLPAWSEKDAESGLEPHVSAGKRQARPLCENFVLDYLSASSKRELDRIKAALESSRNVLLSAVPGSLDDDVLAQRYKNAVALGRLSSTQIDAIDEHCRHVIEKFRKACRISCHRKQKILSTMSTNDTLSNRALFKDVCTAFNSWQVDRVIACKMAGLCLDAVPFAKDSSPPSTPWHVSSLLDWPEIELIESRLASRLYILAKTSRTASRTFNDGSWHDGELAFHVAWPHLRAIHTHASNASQCSSSNPSSSSFSSASTSSSLIAASVPPVSFPANIANAMRIGRAGLAMLE